MFPHCVDNLLRCGSILFWSSPILLSGLLTLLKDINFLQVCLTFLSHLHSGPLCSCGHREINIHWFFIYTCWTTKVLGMLAGICYAIPALHTLCPFAPQLLGCSEPQKAHQSPREKGWFTESNPPEEEKEKGFTTTLSSSHTCCRINSKGEIYIENAEVLFTCLYFFSHSKSLYIFIIAALKVLVC